jgi:hypothetical protein
VGEGGEIDLPESPAASPLRLLPLPVDVGEAIEVYLRRGRVFIRCIGLVPNDTRTHDIE